MNECEPPFRSSKDELFVPETWDPISIEVDDRPVPSYALHCESKLGSSAFYAAVYLSPFYAIWKTHVTMNGSVIHMSEHADRWQAFGAARSAIVMAWELRSPVIK